VTDLSQRLLAQHGGLRGLFRMDIAELARLRGLGDAKSVRLKAALELGRRLAALSPEERPPVGSPEDVANLLSIEMAALEQEQLRVVLLDTKHRILGTRTVYQGSVNQKQWSTGDQERGPDRPAIPVKCERAEAKGVDVITAP
jgi:DNA repair protein RadC